MLGILALIVAALVIFWVLSFGVEVLISIIVWALAGWLASRLMGGDGTGLIGNVLLGVIGGFVGNFLLSVVNLQGIGSIWLVGNIIVGVIGAVVVIFIVRSTTGNKMFGT
jgi:uncharacterized membrane protein YeaQ/YmgE (transglycosylase-associated protein family)